MSQYHTKDPRGLVPVSYLSHHRVALFYNKVEGVRWKKEEGRRKKEDMSTVLGMALHK